MSATNFRTFGDQLVATEVHTLSVSGTVRVRTYGIPVHYIRILPKRAEPSSSHVLRLAPRLHLMSKQILELVSRNSRCNHTVSKVSESHITPRTQKFFSPLETSRPCETSPFDPGQENSGSSDMGAKGSDHWTSHRTRTPPDRRPPFRDCGRG